MATFFDTHRPTTAGEIAALEAKVELVFPASYTAHLLRYNGGRCRPDVFYYRLNGTSAKSIVTWFLGIHEGKYSNLARYIDSYKLLEKRLPSHILPVARDPGLNLICISCGPLDNGTVYFWDHEMEVDYTVANDSDCSNLFFIAEDWEAFLAGLVDDDEEE
jgi:hypothetical protein